METLSTISPPSSITPRNMDPIASLNFHFSLLPIPYSILGTSPTSKLLFLNITILDSTGRDPFPGDVLICGERISFVGSLSNLEREKLLEDPHVQIFEGRGRTLMSGLGDAHTHLTWNGGDLNALGELAWEDHMLLTAKSAKCYLDSGYTMCFGAASAKDDLDVAIRDAINAGDSPGPRYLANGMEIARRDGDLVPGITAYADGPDEMREVIKKHVRLGVDQIKLSMSGEEVSPPLFLINPQTNGNYEITENRSAQDCYFSDEETAACVEEAHNLGRRLCAHARARDSVKMCVKHGVDVLYHASYIDEEGMDMLEAKKDKHIVAPGINWLIATLNDASEFGYSHEKASQVGYRKELEAAIHGLREMHKRGIVVLPGGDYGFAWTPHGTYARDLAHFVNLLGFTPMEAIIAATAGVAKLFMREHELGKIQEEFYADCILVDGNPLEDITILQDQEKLNVIVINGRVHKGEGRK
ncbi:putative isoaspartyl dipeptidase protein [Botrytis fragariae]|uniref:Putative isoaspartyl dipeptidase protein n=1 Tax=Botrytis fragariae TaxID=1964551 RepID=A0A8H6EHK2_9HELO|nr:putative isoaspartyl dipeptidase protein [Botrytis fragariae]KAF5872552.1 putative isoaspartyl dipeptidase protein [Botrytis fragariae]